MRLGVLARTLFVISGLWMAGATYYFASIHDSEGRATADAFFESCAGTQGYDCRKASEEIYAAHTSGLEGGLWGFSAFQAAFWLVLALVAFGILFGAFRWVLAGRK